MLVSVRNFRGFRDVPNINIRPVTILVGENSAGKTSFLAMIRFIYDLFGRVKPSFNKDPFFLGAYDQIAHYRGGKAGRASSFELSISHPISFNKEFYPQFPETKGTAGTMRFVFVNKYAQPFFERISFSIGDFSVEVRFDESGNTFEVSTPSGQFRLDPSHFYYGSSDVQDGLSIESLLFILSNLEYMRERREELTDERQTDLQYISACFSNFVDRMRRDIYASSPVRSKPDRAYSPIDVVASPEGDHIPYLLARLKRHRPDEWESLKLNISRFGSNSGLFKQIELKNLGRSESDPFQIYFDFGGPMRNITDVGYGISQVLPIVTEVFHRPGGDLFLLQQPEVHLHPQAQAALGTLFCDVQVEKDHWFVIESHSDYIIDRVRMAVRDGQLRKSDVSLLFFQRARLENKITEITIDDNGNIVDTPSAYRRFFIEEALRSIS